MPDEDFPPVEGSHMDTHSAHAPQFGAPKKRSKKGLMIAFVAVLVLIAGGAAYWFLVAHKSSAPKTAQSATQKTKPKDNLNEPQADATIKNFRAPLLDLDVAYRSDWTLKESSDKQEVILTSPRTAYTTKAGLAAEGVFTVKLRHGLIPEAMQTTVQNSIAVKDSEVIAYDAPTEGAQRAYTNVSYGGKDAANFSFFIVSSSVSYKAGQPFGSQIDLLGTAYVFTGGYGTDPADAMAFEEVPVASMDSDAYQQAMAIIKSIKVY